MAATSLDVYVAHDENGPAVMVMLRGAVIFESDGELVPGVRLTVPQTEFLIASLGACVRAIEES